MPILKRLHAVRSTSQSVGLSVGGWRLQGGPFPRPEGVLGTNERVECEVMRL